jgi:uncharacterized membrane protein
MDNNMSSSTNAVKRESIHLSMTDFCMTAVCMALTCIATMLIQIPIPLGYAHLGDSVILITAYLFGPVVGALAGGIGSAMADILTGYPVWAVPTLLIKTIMPLIACYIFQNKVLRKPVISVRVLVGAVVTLLFMTAGYVFFGGILYGSWALGLASAPGLLLKSVVNLIVFIVVGTGLSKVVKNR